jgi:hypothetical protein
MFEPNGGEMAEKKSRISQVQTVGEEALGKLASNDVARKLANNDVARSALQTAVNLKDRVEKVLSGYEDLEKRVVGLEKRLADLEGGKKRSSGAKPPSPAESGDSAQEATG